MLKRSTEKRQDLVFTLKSYSLMISSRYPPSKIINERQIDEYAESCQSIVAGALLSTCTSQKCNFWIVNEIWHTCELNVKLIERKRVQKNTKPKYIPVNNIMLGLGHDSTMVGKILNFASPE